jgi:hypothetical protein
MGGEEALVFVRNEVGFVFQLGCLRLGLGLGFKDLSKADVENGDIHGQFNRKGLRHLLRMDNGSERVFAVLVQLREASSCREISQ